MSDVLIDRRKFGVLAGGALASMAFGRGCSEPDPWDRTQYGRLFARPRSGVKTTATGRAALGLNPSGRDGVLQLPAKGLDAPLPLLVLLHGAGGSGAGQLTRLAAAFDASQVAVLAPDSRSSTWDAIRGRFEPDVAFLNRALERVFDTVAVDPARIAVGGFSDGATYAVSLGLINGDLFRRIVAFSPGFVVDGPPQGKPRVFVSHGRTDQILPIDKCSRVIVRRLKDQGYDVTYREFDGGHAVPPEIASEGVQWVAQ